MELMRRTDDVVAVCESARCTGRSVGLVPTMGALHAGHESLLRRAREERGAVVMTLFVNPLQFADAADLAAYPRDERRDLAVAERLGVDVVFAPTPEEMFGRDGARPEVTVDPGPLGRRLEGASRPGHFAGVATIVARLFSIAGRCAAYFGEKDAQQLAVVSRLVRDLGFPVEVVACPTVREPDGLAASSRNERLDAAEREAAGCLFLALAEAAQLARGGETRADVLVAAMAREIGATPLARLDYAVVVDDGTFEPIDRIGEGRPARALVAASFGDVRLIDNLRLSPPASVRED
jgi:pantoate--beta-alanine ligase